MGIATKGSSHPGVVLCCKTGTSLAYDSRDVIFDILKFWNYCRSFQVCITISSPHSVHAENVTAAISATLQIDHKSACTTFKCKFSGHVQPPWGHPQYHRIVRSVLRIDKHSTFLAHVGSKQFGSGAGEW